MVSIKECAVVGETTDQLRTRVEDAIRARHGVLSLMLQPEIDTQGPELEPETVSFRIQRTSHLGDGGDSVTGTEVEITGVEDGVPIAEDLPTTVNLYLAGSPEEPSSASVVVL